MLLPTVAEIEAANNLNKLKTVIRRVVFLGMLLGSICSTFFLLFGSMIGQVLF
jgi:peptidoglycan biosynthesis protein MviN/MurJ (putative lipid II flippase)